SGGSTSATGQFDYGNDWISLRYADVLLMHSEALNESLGTPTAATIEGINAVRARANRDLITLPITQADLRDAIFLERKLELAYEGQYFYDCQRFGNLVEEINSSYERRGTPSNRHYLLPIPFRAREANPSLVQNFGW
ncbi:MAG: RagB/SusD family nutrient uptake outer membrane protein, partial [Bacteroidota bacterium]